jgi:putative ABC transport system permease protein
MRANKLRTSLTVLGIVIGIAAVIIVFSAGEGIRSLVVGEIESFGTDVIETEVKVPSAKKGTGGDFQSATSAAQGIQITTLKLKDMEDIDKLPNIEKSYAAVMGQEQASYGNELRKAFLYGTSASFIEVDKTKVESGRFFTDGEERGLTEVVVLGSGIKEKLFGDSDPIGKSIKIRKSKFTVIGVMEKRGAVFGMDFDSYVYVPLRTLQKKIMGIEHVMFMMHKMKDPALADSTADEIRAVLRENHNITDPDKEDFRVTTMVEAMKTLGTVTSTITILLLIIVAVSLVVGGVGVTNVMYVVVSERTKEIGLRKAVGAKEKDILKQFLLESVLITVMGAIVGIVLGVIVSFLISWGAGQAGLNWKFSVPLRAFLTSLGFASIFGVLFGIFPARKAARLEPVEALRKE